ncbi:MAG: hypothetical protein WDN26_17360 [Chitinophagaceae bacterium]
MKALLNKTRIVAIALVTIFTVAFTAPALANHEKDAAPVEFKYLGKYKNQPVFEVTFNNNEEDNEFIVTIRDEFKNVLYKDFVKAGTISKKYLLNTEEVGNDVGIQFEITGKKTNKTSVYEINRSSRVVEDLAVNKL